jgi:hypothetical protein
MGKAVSTGVPDKAISHTDIDEAIKALAGRVDINNKYWIPYLAGYSKDWSHPCVYINSTFPDTLNVDGKTMRPWRYLLIHESVEKCLMDELGLPYAIAHTFATAAERTAVEADGFSWNAYATALHKPINQARNNKDEKPVPPDLDERPYREEKDPILSKMTSA